ncbi:MAG TPA: cytochrome c peroxidase, partial [Saprospiraceae bacterium]|nr:cytochrome c peroxidase [Saprospiraceae bacterium]
MKRILLLAFTLLLIYSCESSMNEVDNLDNILKTAMIIAAPNGHITYYFLPNSNDFVRIPQDDNNPLTEKKVALGQLLFHETALALEPIMSANKGTYSCASCHHAQAGFSAGTFQGIGEGGIGFGMRGERRVPDINVLDHDVQPVKSPTILNAAYQEVMLWNGQFGAKGINENTQQGWSRGTPKENNYLGFEGIETQAIAGLTVHRQNIDESIKQMPVYKQLFDEVFGNIPIQERYTRNTAGLAIAAFERTVLANDSPWQKYLKGNKIALSNDQKKGAILFFTKGQCVNCHTGPALNSMTFRAIGMADLVDCPEPTLKTSPSNPENLGRGGFTGKQEDNYRFKVPQLYNLKNVNFFG